MSNLFGGGAPSLTESIFGSSDAKSGSTPASKSTSNIDLFAKPTHQHQPAPKRPRTGHHSQTKQKPKSKPGKKSSASTSNSNNGGGEKKKKKSREEILHQRRKQSQAKILNQLTISLDDYKNGHDNEELYADVRGLMKHHGLVILRNALSSNKEEDIDTISKLANGTQKKMCDTLNSKSIPYNSRVNNTESFVFEELAIRCKGRMDVRYCDATTASTSASSSSSSSSSTSKSDKDKGHAQQKLKLPSLSLIDNLAAYILHGAEPPNRVYSGWILSFPNSDDQPWHQDGSPLFDKGSESLPSYALNVFCGLQDSQVLELGPTEFVVGSHHMDPESAMEKTVDGNNGDVVSAVLGRGDILLYDYRICHRGTSNVSRGGGEAGADDDGVIRKVLYLMYARPWFREHLNFGNKSLFD